jgi:hypothetical protein
MRVVEMGSAESVRTAKIWNGHFRNGFEMKSFIITASAWVFAHPFNRHRGEL